MTSTKSPIGYVELPSYEVIDMVATAYDNILVAKAKEVERRKEQAIAKYKTRKFLSDRPDEECYQMYVDNYWHDSIEQLVNFRFSDILEFMNMILVSAKSTDKVLLTIESHNRLLNWIKRNDH